MKNKLLGFVVMAAFDILGMAVTSIANSVIDRHCMHSNYCDDQYSEEEVEELVKEAGAKGAAEVLSMVGAPGDSELIQEVIENSYESNDADTLKEKIEKQHKKVCWISFKSILTVIITTVCSLVGMHFGDKFIAKKNKL